MIHSGVKPVGHWYIKKERRGLVCLVIDNRHNVEKLERLEEEELQLKSRTIENEQPMSFADIFPIPAPSNTKRQRGESPERKFVISFQSITAQDNIDGERGRQAGDPENDLALPDCIDGREGPSSLGESSRTGSLTKRTSQLILGLIPHREIDELIIPGQSVAASALLEAKAEETVDFLMRQWTYVEPEYFSDDDHMSTFSSETLPSFPLSHMESKGPPEENDTTHGDSFRSWDSSRKYSSWKERGSSLQDTPTNKRFDVRAPSKDTTLLNEQQDDKAATKDGDIISTQWAAYSRPVAMDLKDPSDKTPTTPAPPYGCSHHPNCCSVQPTDSKQAGRDTFPGQPSSNAGQETKGGSDPNSVNVLELLCEVLKRPSLRNQNTREQYRGMEETLCKNSEGAPVAQSNNPGSGTDSQLQSISVTQKDEPVIMKDCLGRRFTFPFHTCRTWQVSFPLNPSGLTGRRRH